MLMLMCLVACGPKTKPIIHSSVLSKLYERYERWQGTPYQLGGVSKQGVDCSGFVMVAFDETFGIQLPRTTASQAQLNEMVSKQNLKAGDLVFFKISGQGKLYHVGIYLENGHFLHASTSQGVIISDMTNTYWQDNYWKSVRIIK